MKKRTANALLALSAILALAELAPSANGQPRRGGGARGAAPSSAANPPMARNEAEQRILTTLEEAVRAGKLYANVPAADGRLLWILAESIAAKQVVEIGTSTGLSGLWFSLALQKTGGSLTTFEYDPARAATARANFKAAGADGWITIVEGDAHQTLEKNLPASIDLVFIDADKEGYVDYLNKVLPKLRPGGLILAHNVDMIAEYMKAVAANKNLETIVHSDGGGMAVTLKKR